MILTDAIEAFKREHPEYATIEEAVRIAQIAMATYARCQFANVPVTVGPTTQIWHWCELCRGTGNVGHTQCALCRGERGYFT